MPEVKSEKRSLRYDFKAVEIHELSQQLASKNLDAVEIENEAKSVQSQYNSKLKVIKSEIGKISRQVSDGWEIREVDCDIEYHKPSKGKKTVTRRDTNRTTVEPMESWEWNLFNQEPAEESVETEDTEVEVVKTNEPKLLNGPDETFLES